jgi:hypothetical protein
MAGMKRKLDEWKGEDEETAIDRCGTAMAAFALMEKLERGRPLPSPSISRVFRLYCIEAMSAARVARECRCSKAAVIRRLKLIRRRTGISPRLLRGQEPRLKSLDEVVPGFEVACPDTDNLFYGGGGERE